MEVTFLIFSFVTVAMFFSFMIYFILHSYYKILSYSGLLEDICEMCLFIAEILKNCTAVGYSSQCRPEGHYCVFLTRNGNLMHIHISLQSFSSPRSYFSSLSYKHMCIYIYKMLSSSKQISFQVIFFHLAQKCSFKKMQFQKTAQIGHDFSNNS